jgi:DNA-binding NarL/FixJ family response regulator
MAVRCLLVDDNPGFLRIARKTLETGGFVVVAVATDTAGAVRHARQAHPEVALVDVELGAESGFDLARQLAAADPAWPIQVIMISTHAEEDLADLLAASPAIAFLPKWELSAAAVHELLRSATRHQPDG